MQTGPRELTSLKSIYMKCGRCRRRFLVSCSLANNFLKQYLCSFQFASVCENMCALIQFLRFVLEHIKSQVKTIQWKKNVHRFTKR